MAIITEEPEPEPRPLKARKQARKEPPSIAKTAETEPKHHKPAQTETQKQHNPFVFWFYFTLTVSIITLLVVTFSSFSASPDPKSFYLSLPTPLRHHYSKGRVVKVQLTQNQLPTEIFTFESGKKPSVTEKVLILHGLGLSSFSFRKVVDFLGSKGVHGVVFDLPGSGFSDKSMDVIEEGVNGVFERFSDVYSLIKEKGVFWAFDNMIESGQIPYEEILSHFNRRKRVVKPIVLGGEEIGRVLGQVIGVMGLAPVHLVLHDSSLGMVANWVLENSELVRSVTLLDTGIKPALPLSVLEVPVVREVVLGFNFVYERLISLCCSRGIGGLDVEAHRIIFRERNGIRAVVGMEKKLNYSFDIAEWGNLDVIKGMPLQVIWSRSWSKEWSDEGKKVGEALSQAKFVAHSGGRWPQEDAAEELAEKIVKFVFSLPKSVRQAEEDHIPEHIQKMFDEAKGHDHNDHHHHSHGGHHHHDGHAHSASYPDPYGLGHGWGS